MQESLFSTDLQRLTEILAVNLYDDPFVPIRELLQNANDACLIRQGFTAFQGSRISISINPNERYIEIIDNGCGMTEDEVKNVLSKIASSNKVEKRNRLLQMGFEGAKSIAGKFGLGMLSCFIVANKVEIQTCSMQRNAKPISWYSSGDGRYFWEVLDRQVEIGTRTRLYLKSDKYLDNLLRKSKLQEVIDKFCRFLQIPIYFFDSPLPINSAIAPWHLNCPNDEIEMFVRRHFDSAPLYHFQIQHLGDVKIRSGRFQGEIADKFSLQSMVFIPDSRWSSTGLADVYASGIYVGRLKNILPDWFTFGSIVLESQSLDLTLGRDNIVQDKWKEAAIQVIGDKITEHVFANLQDRSSNLRSRFTAIFRVHAEEIKTKARENYTRGDKKFFDAVKDVIPFDYRGNLVAIPEFARITPPQGDVNGKRVVYYFSQGFGERGGGLQERLLFDSADIPYFNAQNYYDRDFLETYNQASKDYCLIPIQTGIEYIVKFDGIAPDKSELVEEAYKQLGIKAKASNFKPIDIPALITAVSQNRRDRDFDLSTPEGRDEMLQAFVRKELSVGFDPGYTLCINLSNSLVHEIFERIQKDGPQPAYRMALRLVYNNAVILFGEHSNREMANVISTSNSLMQTYLRSIAETDTARNRFSTLLNAKEQELNEIETEYNDLKKKIDETNKNHSSLLTNESNRVFLSYSYRPDDEVLSNGLAQLLQSKGFNVIKGKSDSLGSIKDSIVKQIKSCRYFLSIMTIRQQITNNEFSTSSWFLEEKGVAIGAGKVVILMVEEGISEDFFGTMQGDTQRFHFSRSKDYMLKCIEVADLIIKDRGEFLSQINNHETLS